VPDTAEPAAPAPAPPGDRAAFRLAVFGAVLIVTVATGFGVGRLTGPAPSTPAVAPAAGSAPHTHGGGTTTGSTGSHIDPPGAPPHAHNPDGSIVTVPAAGADVGGLAISANGLRLVPATTVLAARRDQRMAFRIEDAAGAPVTRFAVVHDKLLHLIVARRDLTGFQHLHPTMNADGTWTTPLRLSAAGSYRLFADFSHDETPTTLASDLRVSGTADLEPLPAPAATATSDGGYDVRLDSGAARAGQEAELRFTVTKDGRPVRTEPYLGAGGHLVALREGDLAFLHVHPNEDDSSIGFEATFPTTGSYRLFLQFKVGGEVQTVAFTQEVK
jgi:hypothetical protein